MLSIDEVLPPAPVFSEAQLNECRAEGDFRPILFDLYNHTAMLAVAVACLEQASPAVRELPRLHYLVLVGHLNRCVGLMHASMELMQSNKFADATTILDRCIAEASIRLRWLCHSAEPKVFERYLAQSLKAEFALRDEVDTRVGGRSGIMRPIEDRMLRSIDNDIKATGLDVAELRSLKPLPNLEKMLKDLEETSLTYVVAQRIGSHAVHGTWTNLLIHYLDRDQDQVRGIWIGDRRPHAENMAATSLHVLRALTAFMRFVALNEEMFSPLLDRSQSVEEQIVSTLEEHGSSKDGRWTRSATPP